MSVNFDADWLVAHTALCDWVPQMYDFYCEYILRWPLFQ